MDSRENISCPNCNCSNVRLVKKPTGRIIKPNNTLFILAYILVFLVMLFAVIMLIGSMDVSPYFPTFESERRTAYQIIIYDAFVFFVIFFLQFLNSAKEEYKIVAVCENCGAEFDPYQVAKKEEVKEEQEEKKEITVS